MLFFLFLLSFTILENKIALLKSKCPRVDFLSNLRHDPWEQNSAATSNSLDTHDIYTLSTHIYHAHAHTHTLVCRHCTHTHTHILVCRHCAHTHTCLQALCTHTHLQALHTCAHTHTLTLVCRHCTHTHTHLSAGIVHVRAHTHTLTLVILTLD